MRFWVSKFVRLYRSKGLSYALRRCVKKLGDLTYRGPYIFFCADLTNRNSQEIILRAGISIECCRSEEDISQRDRRVLLEHVREKYLQRNMKERFAKGAFLWLIKVSGDLAGYIWTIRGTTIEPYIRLLTADEVHFFDNLIFEDFRRRGINPVLVNYVLSEMQKQHCVRAFIDTRVTNVAEIGSLAKTDFCKYGLAKKHRSRTRGLSWVQLNLLPARVDQLR